MNDLIGQQLGQYRIDGLLGEGGMGAVFMAYDTGLSRKVVLKIMHQDLAKRPHFQRRFLKEAQAAARLEHPSIVSIYYMEHRPPIRYIAMEYVSTASMADYIAHPLTGRSETRLLDGIRLLAQVADALDYAHEHSIIHRDIKPTNLLLKPLRHPDRRNDPSMRVVVTDFGLAKLLDASDITMHGTFKGTFAYMSPEQCMGKQVDGRADVYSLGVVLYELATGHLPFEVSSPVEAIRAHCKSTPTRPSELREGLPEGLEWIIGHAMAKAPEDRFATGKEMAAALRKVVDDVSTYPVMNGSDHVVGGMGKTYIDGMNGQNGASANGNGAYSAELVIRKKDGSERSVILNGSRPSLSIGRNKNSDISLLHTSVSRNHARLMPSSNGWKVQDLDSTNGLYVGGQRVDPINGPVKWDEQAPLKIGAYTIAWKRAAQNGVLKNGSTQNGILIQENENTLQFQVPETDLIAPVGDLELLVVRRSSDELVEVVPGEVSIINLIVENNSVENEKIQLAVESGLSGILTFSKKILKMQPQSRTEISARLQIPISGYGSGHHAIEIIANQITNPIIQKQYMLEFEIATTNDFIAIMRSSHAGAPGYCQINLQNKGNVRQTFTVGVKEAGKNGEVLTYALDPEASAKAKLRVTPRRHHWFGRERIETMDVLIKNGEGVTQVLPVNLHVKPRIPNWLSLATTVAAIGSAVSYVVMFSPFG